MTIIQAMVLGVVQGLTEFLPVSSTAHLVIAQNLFGFSRAEQPTLLVFDVIVHLGTLLSLFVYFWKDFADQKRGQSPGTVPFSSRLFWLIVIATIPTGIIGLLLKGWMETNFNSLMATVVTLFINSVILWSTKWIPSRQTVPGTAVKMGTDYNLSPFSEELGRPVPKDEVGWLDAVWIGIAQGISILPGISRSGATCATALWLKVKAQEAARFSFLIAIPAILAAAVFVLPESIQAFSPQMWPVMITGFIAAFLSGYIAIILLFRVMLSGKFHLFAIYTFALAIVSLIFDLTR
ncbi:MAG: undecaprenyl-diphosphate phosphatase [Candidatus Omnitrophica bacterium]|nr:undecaprenyl-diphosphate phosphatase [Candidatus Omnitrophota bacterium]